MPEAKCSTKHLILLGRLQRITASAYGRSFPVITLLQEMSDEEIKGYFSHLLADRIQGEVRVGLARLILKGNE